MAPTESPLSEVRASVPKAFSNERSPRMAARNPGHRSTGKPTARNRITSREQTDTFRVTEMYPAGRPGLVLSGRDAPARAEAPVGIPHEFPREEAARIMLLGDSGFFTRRSLDMSSEKLNAEIGRLAPSRATVLLHGGQGDSREQVARALHERSPRADEPFVVIDCATLDGEALERRLFGGPYGDRLGAGIVHEMGRGTLYVAAVEGLPRVLQPRFLAFLDGDRRGRVVVSEGAALEAEIAAERFRADLGDRLLLVQLVLTSG